MGSLSRRAAYLARGEFRRVYQVLDRRIELFLSLPLASLDRLRLRERLSEIGKSGRPERESR